MLNDLFLIQLILFRHVQLLKLSSNLLLSIRTLKQFTKPCHNNFRLLVSALLICVLCGAAPATGSSMFSDISDKKTRKEGTGATVLHSLTYYLLQRQG